MLGIPLRYLMNHPRAMSNLGGPADVWARVYDAYVQEREWRGPQSYYESDADWECRLHHLLGLQWPCELTSEFWDVWAEVIGGLQKHGIRPGPISFREWNDGDAALVRSIWCLVRHLAPKHVVETGVAHGVTSRFVLEALSRNRGGHLWSIDFPPIEDEWRKQIGIAVSDRFRANWSYIQGPSRQRLPELLSKLGRVDLFIHDSLHSERNVRFELEQAWPLLRPGSALVIDDIDANWAFQTFTQTFAGQQSLVCEAEPIHPDPRRFNQKGQFGIIVKEATPFTLAPTDAYHSRPEQCASVT